MRSKKFLVLIGLAALFAFFLLAPEFGLAQGENIGGAIGGAAGDVTTKTATEPAGFGSPLATLISEESGFVYQAWRVTRSVINILLIIGLMAISFSNITRINIDTYTIKKALPNLIIGIILANASLYIIRFMSDITTVVTYFFVNQGNSTTFADFIGDAAQLIGVNSLKTTILATGIFAPLLIFLFAIVTFVGLLWLAFLFYFRLVAIYLLTILSPLAFVSYGIPGLDKYFKQWWQQFTKWLFIVPAMSAVFWLMLVIGNAGGDNQSVARLLIMYVLFFMALTLPSKMGGAVIDKASKAFMKYTGAGWARDASQKAAADAAKDAGRWIGSRTPGLYRLQEWNKLRKENFENSLKDRSNKAAARARSGRAGLKEAKLTQRLVDSGLDLDIQKSKNLQLASEKNQFGLLAEIKDKKKLKETIEDKIGKIEAKVDLEFELSDDPERKRLREDWIRSRFEKEAIAARVGRAENIAKGNYATTRKNPLQGLDRYAAKKKMRDTFEKDSADWIRVDNEMKEIEEQLDREIKNGDHVDAFGTLKVKDFNEALKAWEDKGTMGETLKAFHKRGFKEEMESIENTIGDDIKFGDIRQLSASHNQHLRDTYKNATKEQLATIQQLLLSGDTAGVMNYAVRNNITNTDGKNVSNDEIRKSVLYYTTMKAKQSNRFERTDATMAIANDIASAYGDGVLGAGFTQKMQTALENNKTQNQAISYLNTTFGVLQGQTSSHQVNSNKPDIKEVQENTKGFFNKIKKSNKNRGDDSNIDDEEDEENPASPEEAEGGS